MPRSISLRAVALCATALAIPASAPAQPPAEPDPPPAEEIVIRGRRPTGAPAHRVAPDASLPGAADSADLLELVPGADVVRNGSISGQVQYRGLFGYRLGVAVDGMYLHPAGPNWMDPPLHYAPRPLLAGLAVERGIASIRSGAETIGGSVRATLETSRFATGDALEVHGAGQIAGRSADEGLAGGGIVWAANRSHRLHALGSHERGGDLHSADGDVHPSAHERHAVGAGYGFQHGGHELGLDYRHVESHNAGTPSLPMDLRTVDAEIAGGRYRGTLGPVGLEARLHYDEIFHRMDNFALRAPPGDPALLRFAEIQADGIGYGVEASVPLLAGSLAVGNDGHFATNDMRIFDPNAPAFFVTNLNDVERDRYSVYAQWEGEPLARLHAEVGVRYTRVESNAGPVDALPAQMMPPPMRLRDAQNAADRSRSEDDVDWVVKLGFAASDSLLLEIAAGRKTRAPSHLERYLWLPLEVSAGLADGNNYVGSLGLDSEVAHEVEGGFAWRGDRVHLAPRAFYRRIDDYIQGVPATNPDVVMVSTANGDPTPLRYANVDAELYGLDAEWGIRLPLRLQLDGVVSWVRGKRRDVDDDLFRIAPLHGRATLRYAGPHFSAGVEGVFAARQGHVSTTNGETTTSGYGLLNLFAAWEPVADLWIWVGVENVLDDLHRDHLAGTNRVANSGVALGRRLPGAGRNAVARVAYRF